MFVKTLGMLELDMFRLSPKWAWRDAEAYFWQMCSFAVLNAETNRAL